MYSPKYKYFLRVIAPLSHFSLNIDIISQPGQPKERRVKMAKSPSLA